MQSQTIVALISTLAQTARVLAPEVEEAIEILTSEDADKIHVALAQLRAAGDALHDRVHAKLALAASPGGAVSPQAG